MPLYEYACLGCGNKFEALVRDAVPPTCPACESDKLERLLSLFAVNSEGTRQANLVDGKKAARKVELDRAWAQHDRENNHHH